MTVHFDEVTSAANAADPTDQAPPTAATTGQTGRSEDNRAAIDKAISLLTAFGAQASSGVGVSELARRADLSKSTAFRVLGLLERNGVVDRVGRKYRLGARLRELGRNVHASNNDRLRDRLIPFLAELYEATHETIQLTAINDTEIVTLAKLYGHRSVACPLGVGTCLPSHATACGNAMLAHNPRMVDHLVEVADRRGLEAVTPRTITDISELQVRLAKIRQQGLAYADSELRAGQHCISAPVIGPNGHAVAALSISAPKEKDLRQHTLVLRRTAAAASQALQRSARQARATDATS